MTTLSRVLIMAGGTGGHIFPALAVAELLRAEGVDVHWLGTRHGMENQLVPKANIPLHYISISGIRRTNKLTLLMAPFKLLWAILQACRIIWKLKPQAVLGMGGFVSGPGGIAAFIMRKKLVIHEQNAIAGMTNRQLARFAKKVLQGYPNTFKEKYHPEYIGNPVRQNLIDLPNPTLRYQQHLALPVRILIIGGSQGAHFINEKVVEALCQIAAHHPIVVQHQTGKADLDFCQTSYQQHGMQTETSEFIVNMADAYARADLLICRAGALTVAEIMAVGIASVLIPFPYAVDDHQTYNAMPLVDAGAAILIKQSELTIERLVTLLTELIKKRQTLLTMANAAYSLRKTQATQNVVTYLGVSST